MNRETRVLQNGIEIASFEWSIRNSQEWVMLDIAALGRQDIEPEETVQLELEGVRLKTGLKLLLDQAGRPTRVHWTAEDFEQLLANHGASRGADSTGGVGLYVRAGEQSSNVTRFAVAEG